MTPPDYKELARKFPGLHTDYPEDLETVAAFGTQADALGYARGVSDAFTKAHEIVAGYGAYECAQAIHDEFHDAARALTAEPAKEVE